MATHLRSPDSWTETGLLDELERIDGGHHGHKICFILGAGASVSSGVPTGGQLVDEWLHTEHKRETDGNQDFESWAVEWAKRGEPIKGFDPKFPAKFYPQIFERIYAGRYAQAYEFLDEKMKDAQPGIGYVLLAQILEFSRHKPIITTNFDNLVAEALYFYSGTRPLICGHEALAVFATANTIRPLVAKIHRDLYLNPINDPEGTSRLADNWKKALTEIFRVHTPVVIGYGGNDGSLMGFLNSLELGALHNGIYWCHRGEALRDEVLEVISKHHGKLVAIDGFDQFMLKLYGRLSKRWERKQRRKIESFIRERADNQIARYKLDFDKFGSRTVTSDDKRTTKGDETIAALRKVSPDDKSAFWWQWTIRADAEKDINKRDSIYRQGIESFPNSAQLLGSYALFVSDVRKDYDKAEKLYSKALKLDPKNVANIGNFANLKKHIRKDYDGAERLYRRILELDPANAITFGNLAGLIQEARKDYGEAERFYRMAAALDPTETNVAGNLSGLLLAQGRNPEGLALLERTIAMLTSDSPLALCAEVWFYAFLHRSTEQRADALKQLKELLLKNNARSQDWDFSKNIERAISDGHPDAVWLPRLADVINDKADPGILNDWPAWKAA